MGSLLGLNNFGHNNEAVLLQEMTAKRGSTVSIPVVY